MAQPYVGEIRMFGGNFAPAGWLLCEGQVLPISENETLFSIIGTTYGGDGENTFGLPDLRGRIPVHQGAGAALGSAGGVEQVTLTESELPTHAHPYAGSTNLAENATPVGSVVAQSTTGQLFRAATPGKQFAENALADTGGSQPHDNVQPYLCINYIISLFGIYPSKT